MLSTSNEYVSLMSGGPALPKCDMFVLTNSGASVRDKRNTGSIYRGKREFVERGGNRKGRKCGDQEERTRETQGEAMAMRERRSEDESERRVTKSVNEEPRARKAAPKP